MIGTILFASICLLLLKKSLEFEDGFHPLFHSLRDWGLVRHTPIKVMYRLEKTKPDLHRCLRWNHATRNVWCPVTDCPSNN